jgi:hypothetical protein
MDRHGKVLVYLALFWHYAYGGGLIRVARPTDCRLASSQGQHDEEVIKWPYLIIHPYMEAICDHSSFHRDMEARFSTDSAV